MLKLNESNLKIKNAGFFKPVFFKFLFKQNWKIIIIFAILIVFFSVGIAVITAFTAPTSMSKPNFFTFIFNQLFPMSGSLFVILLVVLLNKSTASLVDRGDLAYILCSRTSRKQIVLTTYFFSLMLVIVIVLMNFLIILASGLYTWVNGIFIVQQFIIFLVLVSIANFISCLFNKTWMYFFVCSGLFIMFYMFNMIGNMGTTLAKQEPTMKWLADFKYVSIITIFNIFFDGLSMDPDHFTPILKAEGLIICDCILVIICVALVISSLVIFRKKDLPI